MIRPSILLLILAPAKALAQDYTFTPIDFPGAADTRTLGVNDSNQIVGSYRLVGEPGRHHGLLYDGGAFQTIEPEGSSIVRIRAINGSGTMVGFYKQEGFVFFRGFIRVGDTFSDIRYPSAAQDTFALGINSLGQVVGGYVDVDGYEHGYLLDGGIYSTLDCPGMINTEADGIDSNGRIVGWCDNGPVETSVAFIYDGASFTTFNCPVALDSAALGINSNGAIVGAYDENLTTTHGFVSVDGGSSCTQIDYPGAPNTELRGITASGNLVGIYYQPDFTNIRGFFASPN